MRTWVRVGGCGLRVGGSGPAGCAGGSGSVGVAHYIRLYEWIHMYNPTTVVYIVLV